MLISLATRKEFREWMTGWVLRQIDEEFQNAGLHVDPYYESTMQGERRRLIDTYYHAVDFTDWGQVNRLLKVYETVIDQAESTNSEQLPKFIKCLSRDGFIYEEHRILPKGGHLALKGISQIAIHFDASYINTQVARIEASVDSDPALAIGSAKELVETCCKTILSERGVVVEEFMDLPKLVKVTLKELKLAPEDVKAPKKETDTAKKAEEAMKRLLQNLGGIAGSLAELRNLLGTGHGPDGKVKGPKPHHAKLAAGAATTFVMFLFESHRENLSKTKLHDQADAKP